MRHKYGAKPTTVDGIRFHSMKEARRYQELKLLERAGEIQNLSLQPEFPLHAPDQEKPVGRYIADFEYLERGKTVTEDVKGYDTAFAKWKRKHLKMQYGFEVRIT